MNDENENVKAIQNTVFLYKKGKLSLVEASECIAISSGLSPEVVSCFLRAMKRDNIRKLKGSAFG